MNTQYLNLLKTSRNLSWQEIADLSGVPATSVRNIFSGDTQTPGFQSVCAIVYALGGSIDEMTGHAPKAEPADDRLSAAYEERIACIKAEHAEHVKRINDLHEAQDKRAVEGFERRLQESIQREERLNRSNRFILLLTAVLLVINILEDVIARFIA
jgi:transcriptional regulator with XRE-family HTH domain